MEELEGIITKQLHNAIKRTTEINLLIEEEDFFFKLSLKSSAPFEVLTKGAKLRLKGKLNKEKRIISDPHDIWVKID